MAAVPGFPECFIRFVVHEARAICRKFNEDVTDTCIEGFEVEAVHVAGMSHADFVILRFPLLDCIVVFHPE